jgi:ABC-type dipeptide/oligopeptide/nickel transport system ATPase component
VVALERNQVDSGRILSAPQHPYTQRLLVAAPRIGTETDTWESAGAEPLEAQLVKTDQ